MKPALAILLGIALSMALTSAGAAETSVRGNMEPVVLEKVTRLTPPVRNLEMRQDGETLVLMGAGLRAGQITSGSMVPLIPKGQTFVWQIAQASDVQVGDILVWDTSSCRDYVPGLIAHQVVVMTGGGPSWRVATRGWSNRLLDSCIVTPEMVRGIVVLR